MRLKKILEKSKNLFKKKEEEDLTGIVEVRGIFYLGNRENRDINKIKNPAFVTPVPYERWALLPWDQAEEIIKEYHKKRRKLEKRHYNFHLAPDPPKCKISFNDEYDFHPC